MYQIHRCGSSLSRSSCGWHWQAICKPWQESSLFVTVAPWPHIMPVIVFLLATVTKFGNATVTRTMFQLLSQKSNNLSVRTTNIYICGIEILLTVEHPTWTPYKAQTTNYLILPRTLPSLTTEIDSQIRTWSYVGPGQWRQSGRLGVRAINVQVQRGVVRVAKWQAWWQLTVTRHGAT